MPRDTLIQVRRGSSSNWNSQNPILEDGELGFENDSNKLKIGNGVSNWKSLDYIGLSETYIKVKNNSGYALNKGQAVYINGTDSETPTVSLYISNNTISEQKFAGLVSAYIPNNEYGFVINFGILSGIDTTGNISNIAVGNEVWSNNDILYVSPYDYGKLTINKPIYNVVIIGMILNKNSNGSLLVRSFINPKFNQLNGVNIISPIDSNIIKYQDSSGNWVNSDQIDCGVV